MSLRVLVLVALLINVWALDLTKENFADLVLDGGKNAFVAFLVPWSGHCRMFKHHWKLLEKEYADHVSVVVGNVDCSAEHALCKEQGVEEYPTLQYWVEGEKHTYEGERGLLQLQTFTTEQLDPSDCDYATLKGCTQEETNAYIQRMSAMTPEERRKLWRKQ
jgi:thiol-disulfide isomerase/thioredoxin